MTPDAIEKLSFDIIDGEAGDHGFSPDAWQVVRRVIHTSADFEYLGSIRIHPSAISAGIRAIRSGCPIFTDTNMARAGISARRLTPFGTCVDCLMADPRVAEAAASRGTTRALAAVDMAADRLSGGIYVVGNAPTALMRLMELADLQKASPALIVGLPVGFVNAAESKEVLLESDIPYITNAGRKGGSNVAAAVINALAILSQNDDTPLSERAPHE